MNSEKEVLVEAPTTPPGASIHSKTQEIQEWKRRLNALTLRLEAIEENAKTRLQPRQEAQTR